MVSAVRWFEQTCVARAPMSEAGAASQSSLAFAGTYDAERRKMRGARGGVGRELCSEPFRHGAKVSACALSVDDTDMCPFPGYTEVKADPQYKLGTRCLHA